MKDDPLDKNVSIGTELTDTGLNLNARSRAVTAFDRLVGNVADYVNIPLERRNVQARTRMESERQLVEAIRDHAIGRMKTDPEFADRAAENYLRSLTSRQENKDAVARQAIEDLRRDPAADEAGPELDPLFVNKLERHAEDAATESLREKWGRVLAAEVRHPGTITPRVMRIIDEIDAETAQLFERFCTSRLANCVPTCLSGKLEFDETTKLVGAGLIVDPGFVGQVRLFSESALESGEKLHVSELGRRAIGLPRGVSIPQTATGDLPFKPDKQGNPTIPIYVLTDEGYAVSRILVDNEDAAFDRYLGLLRNALPSTRLFVFGTVGAGRWRLERVLEGRGS